MMLLTPDARTISYTHDAVVFYNVRYDSTLPRIRFAKSGSRMNSIGRCDVFLSQGLYILMMDHDSVVTVLAGQHVDFDAEHLRLDHASTTELETLQHICESNPAQKLSRLL